MSDRRSLIVVSNRAPVTYRLDRDGNRVTRRGGGGLVTALRSLVSHHDVIWIASAMSDEDRRVVSELNGGAVDETAEDGAPYRLRLVAHDPKAYDWYYNVVSNPTLWFIHHYLWGLAHAPDVDQGLHHAWSDGYEAVNRNFAEAVLAELDVQPEAAVLFHDYHLYVAPGLVRGLAPDVPLAHFVHVPWPQPDYWRVLPDGIRRRCTRASSRTTWSASIPTAGGRTSCGAARTSPEPMRISNRARSASTAVACSRGSRRSRSIRSSSTGWQRAPEVIAEEQAIAERRPEFLVLRVDRTDPSKNVVRGFRAYELYLEAHPEMHGRVTMLALLDPSRQDIPEYAEYLGAIQRASRVVNDRFQQGDWLPLDLQVQDNFPQAVAAYKQYDALLVNAIFDGMNLVAKEAPLVNERDGVLILSENAGAHEELAPWALTVNPFDVAGQADAIHEALDDGRRGTPAPNRGHSRPRARP